MHAKHCDRHGFAGNLVLSSSVVFVVLVLLLGDGLPLWKGLLVASGEKTGAILNLPNLNASSLLHKWMLTTPGKSWHNDNLPVQHHLFSMLKHPEATTTILDQHQTTLQPFQKHRQNKLKAQKRSEKHSNILKPYIQKILRPPKILTTLTATSTPPQTLRKYFRPNAARPPAAPRALKSCQPRFGWIGFALLVIVCHFFGLTNLDFLGIIFFFCKSKIYGDLFFGFCLDWFGGFPLVLVWFCCALGFALPQQSPK